MEKEEIKKALEKEEARSAKKTIVYELGSNRSLLYTVPPEQAVVNAYYQLGLNNYNTWEYDYSKVKYAQCHNSERKIAYCGNFAARC